LARDRAFSAGAVIAGAIDDAIGMPGAVTRLPVTPQRLRELPGLA
jgi:carbon-monoxide dehydrogenase large subunit/6-hydroxypseudooxynicotine dehydrogenase subunit gamma